jgi:anti-anti-sigma regulatory factor
MLNITVENEELDKPVAVIHLEGELDHENYEELIATAREVRDSGVVRLVLDLADLSYMGSSGIFALRSIAVIVGANEPPDPDSGWGAVKEQAPSTEERGAVKLLNPQPQVDRVLSRTGLKPWFPTFNDRAEALAAF